MLACVCVGRGGGGGMVGGGRVLHLGLGHCVCLYLSLADRKKIFLASKDKNKVLKS